MRRLAIPFLAAALLAACSREPARVLVYTVSAGYEHEVVKRPEPETQSLVEQKLAQWGAGDTRLRVFVTRDARIFSPVRLADYDAICFYTTGELALDAEQKQALISFVQEGGGFVGVHSATDTFYEFPEYGEMIGAWFDGHPWHEEVRVRVEDKQHPATAHLGDSFTITDEIYQFKAPYDRQKLHVLLSLDPAALDLDKPGVKRSDRDFAVAWTRPFGDGRVFYTSLGHRPEVWEDERFRKHLTEGLLWAADGR